MLPSILLPFVSVAFLLLGQIMTTQPREDSLFGVPEGKESMVTAWRHGSWQLELRVHILNHEKEAKEILKWH